MELGGISVYHVTGDLGPQQIQFSIRGKFPLVNGLTIASTFFTTSVSTQIPGRIEMLLAPLSTGLKSYSLPSGAGRMESSFQARYGWMKPIIRLL